MTAELTSDATSAYPPTFAVGLTDYEVRDLNDEINKLLREKNHWENQIIALGGANYKRGIRSMTDDSGREIPGTRGYKYFGRAKDLPGVKELLNRSVAEAEEAEEGYKSNLYKRFANQPPSYLGDEDEDDGVLLEEEEAREKEMWAENLEALAEQLGLEHGDDKGQGSSSGSLSDIASKLGLPAELPRRRAENLKAIMQRNQAAAANAPRSTAEGTAEDIEPEEEPTSDGKRKSKSKAADAAKALPEDATGGSSKRSKTEAAEGASSNGDDLLAQILPALDPAQLSAPKVPDRKETEAFILRERKRMLREEYNVGETASNA